MDTLMDFNDSEKKRNQEDRYWHFSTKTGLYFNLTVVLMADSIIS